MYVCIIIIIIIMCLSDAASLGYDHMTPVHQDNIKCNYPQSEGIKPSTIISIRAQTLYTY